MKCLKTSEWLLNKCGFISKRLYLYSKANEAKDATSKRSYNDYYLFTFLEAVTNVRINVSLEQLMKEQKYKPITYQAFRKKADELEWEETLDELLETLK